MIIILFLNPPFYPNVRVSNEQNQILNQGESSFVVYNGHIYVICNIAERNSIPAIPFSRSDDYGNSFPLYYNFVDNTTNITWHTDPVIGIDDSGYVHMIVQFYTNYIKHYLSKDGGLTWSDTSFVTDPSTGGDVDKPWMVVRGETVYVSWQEFGGNSDGIKFARSFDRGKTWQRFQVDPTTTGITALAVSKSGIIYLAYVSDNIYFTKSLDKGQTWTNPLAIDYVYYSSGYGDRAPINSLAVFGDNVLFLAWVDSRNGNWDIRGTYSYNGGNTWSNPSIINKLVNGGQCKSWVSYDPYGNLHLMYYHTPSWPTSSSSIWSIYYQISRDSGKTWSNPIRVSDTTFLDKAPSSTNGFMGDYHMIFSDSNFVYVIWSDGRDGNQNLYFSKAPILSVINPELRNNLSYSEEFEIYTVDGRLIKKTKNLNNLKLKKGIYIIKSKDWLLRKIVY